MSTDNRDERLARRMTDSYAIERQFAGARPIEAITAAINRPGVRMPEVVRTVPVQRIPDYDGWLQRFETSLCALREQERQHSLLPLLHRYRRLKNLSAGPWHPQIGSVPRCKTRKSAPTKTSHTSPRRSSSTTSPTYNCSHCYDAAREDRKPKS